jgi:hypothetical protein
MLRGGTVRSSMPTDVVLLAHDDLCWIATFTITPLVLFAIYISAVNTIWLSLGFCNV